MQLTHSGSLQLLHLPHPKLLCLSITANVSSIKFVNTLFQRIRPLSHNHNITKIPFTNHVILRVVERGKTYKTLQHCNSCKFSINCNKKQKKRINFLKCSLQQFLNYLDNLVNVAKVKVKFLHSLRLLLLVMHVFIHL